MEKGGKTMSERHISVLAAGASILAIFATAPARAQQAADPGLSSASGLEEIVVTARRREEKLQSVPLSITAFSQDDLQLNNIQDAGDLQHFVPSLEINGVSRNSQTFTIRGLGNANLSAGGLPNVLTYFAEVPVAVDNALLGAGGGGGPGLYYDLENLQVLKGPQGTLFGRNVDGGAILLSPRKPTDEFSGYAQVSLGDYNLHEVQAAVNVPLVPEKLFARVSGDFNQRDGFTRDVANGKDLDNRDYWAGRLSLVWRPIDDFENYLLYNSLYSHTNATSVILGAIKPGGLEELFFPPSLFQAALAEQQKLGPREEVGNIADPIDKTYTFSLIDTAKWDVSDNITLKNIFGYQEFKNLNRQSFTGTSIPLAFDSTPNGWDWNQAQYDEELQIQGKSLDDHLTWTTGAFYEYSHPIFGPSQPGTLPSSQQTLFGGADNVELRDVQRSRAVYAQGTYDLGALASQLDGLKFTGGYRYTWDDRSTTYKNIHATLGCLLGGVLPNCESSLDGTFHAPTWTLGLDYQFDASTLFYVTGRRGYRSGGFNPQAEAGNFEFKPEYVTDVEIGVKADWQVDDIKVRTNVAAYQTDYTDIQLNLPNVNAAGTSTLNAAAATVQGLEFEGHIVPVAGLDIALTYAWYKGTFDSFLAGIALAEQPEHVGLSPTNKFSINPRYTLPVDPTLGTISLSVAFTYQSATPVSTVGGDPLGRQSPYGLLNISADWNDIAEQPIDLSFFMTNATDKLYKVGAFSLYDSLGASGAIYGEPRMFGFQARYRFGGPAQEATPAPAAYVPPAVQAPVSVPKSYLVFFDFNKSDLTPQAVEIVDQAAKNAEATKVTQLTVTGHTDTVGSDVYNMRLSHRRAESVAAQLEKDGIRSSEIEIVARGKRDLLVPTADGVKEPQNRRVQIVYSGSVSS
jgi:iron complex outermembrane receptor protein